MNHLGSNRSEFAKIILNRNRTTMNREWNRFAVYPEIHSPHSEALEPFQNTKHTFPLSQSQSELMPHIISRLVCESNLRNDIFNQVSVALAAFDMSLCWFRYPWMVTDVHLNYLYSPSDNIKDLVTLRSHKQRTDGLNHCDWVRI